MAKNRTDENFKSYPIPYNFIDESKMLGGMVKTRNFVEGCVCAIIASIPILVVPSISLNARIILFIILALPALVFGIIGLNGDPISNFIIYYIKFKKSRRIVSFNNKVKLHERIDVDSLSETELPRDKIIKILNNLGARREKADEQEITDAEDFIFDDDLEEIKRKEEEAKNMLKASGKYVQNITPQTEFANVLNSFDENIIDNNINEYENTAQLNEIEDSEYEDIPILHEVLSSQINDLDNLLDLDEDMYINNEKLDNTVVTLEDEYEDIINQDIVQNDEEMVVLSGDFVDSYKEVTQQKDNPKPNDTPNLNSEITQLAINVQKTNNKPPVKKNIVLPWMCQCGIKNFGKFCSECGKPKP